MALTTTTTRGRLPRRPRFFYAALAGAAFVAVQGAAFPGQWLGAEGDDVMYAMLSRSLAHGRYALGILPGDPLFSQFTPGLPVFLLPAAVLAPDHALGYQLAAFLWLAACDALLFFFLLPRAGRLGALALTAAFALNPLVLSRSGVVMPEVPGVCLALVALLLVDRSRPAPGLVAGVVAGAAYLLRPGVLPLSAAVPAAYWARGRRRDAVSAAAAALVWWALWRAWAASAGGFSDLGEGLGAVAAAGWRAWPRIAAANLAALAGLWGRTATPFGVEGAASRAAGAVLVLAAARGLWRGLRPGPPAWAAFLAGSLALHALWPWWYERYLVGLLPFLLLAAWMGGRAWGLSRRTLAAAATALAVVPLAVQGRAVVRRAAEPPPGRDLYRFLAALPAPGLVASVSYAPDAWYSGRACVPLPLEGPETSAEALARRRVRWVRWGGVPDAGASLGEAAPLSRSLARWEERMAGPGFRRVWQGPGGSVYEVAGGTKVTGAVP